MFTLRRMIRIVEQRVRDDQIDVLRELLDAGIAVFVHFFEHDGEGHRCFDHFVVIRNVFHVDGSREIGESLVAQQHFQHVSEKDTEFGHRCLFPLFQTLEFLFVAFDREGRRVNDFQRLENRFYDDESQRNYELAARDHDLPAVGSNDPTDRNMSSLNRGAK